MPISWWLSDLHPTDGLRATLSGMLVVGESPLAYYFDEAGFDHIGWPDRLPVLWSYRPEVVVQAHLSVHPKLSLRDNTSRAGQVALWAASMGAEFIHISSSLVFDGNRGPYAVSSRPYPTSVQGMSLRSGELAVRALHPRASILRVSGLYGDRFWDCPPMAAMRGARVWDNVFDTPVHGMDAVRAVLRHLERLFSDGASPGVGHIAPVDRVSWWSFVNAIFPGTLPVQLHEKGYVPSELEPVPKGSGLVPSHQHLVTPSHAGSFVEEVKDHPLLEGKK